MVSEANEPGSESGKRSDDRRGAARGTRAGSWSPQEGGASNHLAARLRRAPPERSPRRHGYSDSLLLSVSLPPPARGIGARVKTVLVFMPVGALAGAVAAYLDPPAAARGAQRELSPRLPAPPGRARERLAPGVDVRQRGGVRGGAPAADGRGHRPCPRGGRRGREVRPRRAARGERPLRRRPALIGRPRQWHGADEPRERPGPAKNPAPAANRKWTTSRPARPRRAPIRGRHSSA